GDTYGLHAPLLAGTEVAIAFEEGNPDRPYIAYALHDSKHGDHVTLQNYKRNVLRTPANNKLRLDDERGKEHIKLSTEYGGKTQLNLGHLVDSQKQQRGEGFELRTDDWGAIRAGKGIFISADGQPKAGGKVLEMDQAVSLIKGAISQMTDWGTITQSHHNLQPESESLKNYLTQATQLTGAALLMSAPQGIGAVSPETVMLQSGKALYLQSQGEINLASAQRFQQVLELANRYPMLYAALGLHPLYIAQHREQDIDVLVQALAQKPNKLVAIGEIGLDLFMDDPQLERQITLLKAQLKLAKQYDLPVILHSRRSHDQLARELRNAAVPRCGVVHGFSGSLSQAQAFIKLGYFIGVGGTITYERAQKTRQVIAQLPLSALLLETDAPDMPLAGYQGQPNRPERVRQVFETLCQLRPESPAVIAEAILVNTDRLFGISA
ncbi:TatD family hydrolase, partial [Hafnia alvei]